MLPKQYFRVAESTFKTDHLGVRRLHVALVHVPVGAFADATSFNEMQFTCAVDDARAPNPYPVGMLLTAEFQTGHIDGRVVQG